MGSVGSSNTTSEATAAVGHDRNDSDNSNSGERQQHDKGATSTATVDDNIIDDSKLWLQLATHYGDDEVVMPYEFGPVSALAFPAR